MPNSMKEFEKRGDLPKEKELKVVLVSWDSRF
jgi:hypothetical protein